MVLFHMDLTQLLHMYLEPLQPMDVTLAIPSLERIQQDIVLGLMFGVTLLPPAKVCTSVVLVRYFL